jgi:hypothetical protein
MALTKGAKANFSTIQLAAENDALALMECTDKATGKPVATVCAVHMEDGQYVFSPLAKLFDGNPYEELLPPT